MSLQRTGAYYGQALTADMRLQRTGAYNGQGLTTDGFKYTRVGADIHRIQMQQKR